jgi:hypothetical protein
MARIDEQRKQRLEQALQDMGNYGVKLRKPEELPDFDQPIDYEEEKKRFEPVKVEEQNDKESHKDYSQPSLSRNRVVTNGKGYFYRRESSTNGKNKGQEAIIRVSGEISPALSQQPPQSRVCIRGNSTKVGLRGEENR